MLGAVLLDVGGTLWPDIWPQEAADDQERVIRLLHAVPALSEREALELVAALSPLEHPASDRQQTDALIAGAIRRVRPTAAVALSGVRTAMCLPARGRVELFAGARELVVGLAYRGVRVIILSNVLWRDERAHRCDFDDFGLSDSVHAYVTSVDVGWRKPHPAIFDAALLAAGHPPSQCAMVGDSEANDIVPARSSGLLTIRVAIEQPLPSTSVADYVCGSLAEVAALLFEQLYAGS